MKKLIPFILFLIVLCSFASAIKTTQTNILEVNTEGLTIVTPQFLYFPSQSSINLSFDVLDSNFTRLNDSKADCFIYIVNNYGSNFSSGKLSYLHYWYFNFNSDGEGDYSFYTYCNATNGENGFVSDNMVVTRNGREEYVWPVFALLLLIGGMIAFYLYLVKNFKVDLFEENGALKLFFIMLSFWLTLLPFYIFILFNDRFGLGTVSDLMNAVWPYMIGINIGITFYFMMYLIVKMLRSISKK